MCEPPDDNAPVQPAGTGRGRLRKWVRRLALAVVLLPLLAFGLSNLWLAIPWGRATLAEQVRKRSGLETSIGRASWSPWQGVTIRNLVIQQPDELRAQVKEPLLAVERIQVQPQWRALFRGQLKIHELAVEGPSLTLTVEMMSHLAKQAAPVAEPPLLAAGRAQPQPTPGIPQSAQPALEQFAQVEQTPATEPTPTATPATPPTPPAIQPATPAAQPTPPATPPATPAAQPTQPATPAAPAAQPAVPHPAAAGRTRWLRCRHGSWRLRSAATGKDLLEALDIDAAVPFAGAAAKGSLRLAALTAAGQGILKDFQAEITWDAPILTFTPAGSETTVAGIKTRLGGQVALLAGLPVTMGVEVPRQSASVPVPALDLTVDSREILGQARFYGYLLSPGSWTGDLLAGATSLQARHSSRTFSFDRAGCAMVIRAGTLNCLDARLIGEEFSLLGNGALLADGSISGTLRLVAAPPSAQAMASVMFPDLDHEPNATPLSSPQRVALDIDLRGTLAAPFVRVGAGAPFGPLTLSRPASP